MSALYLPYIVCAGEVIVLGVANVVSFVPTIARVFIMKNVDSYHKDPVSDIPGNPHAFSPAIISLFRTLPEPSNFNIVWTGLTLKEPLLIKGALPMARFSSLSVYGVGSAETPNSIELSAKTDGNRAFDLVITPDGKEGYPVPSGAVVVSSNNWQRGFVSMRNYLVPPGTRVITPEIVRLSDGKVVRPAAAITAGPCGLDLRDSQWKQAFIKCIQINAVVFATNHFLFSQSLGTTAPITVTLLGAVVGYVLYALCFIFGKKRLTQLTRDICKTQNAFHFASLEQGSKASQPSKLHKYWLMRHDVDRGSEIKVTVKINPAFQKYWSLVVYDEYGLPLPQYVYDENCFIKPVASTAAGTGKGVYTVDIRLRHATSAAALTSNDGDANVVDVSACAKGYVLFRVNHPVGEHVVDFSTPLAELQPL